MAGDDKRYSRLYWKLASEHPLVWADPLQLGTFMLALVTAEQSWPQPATRPSTCKPSTWRKLHDEGLVIDIPGGYTVKGLDKERAGRSARARQAAQGRWDRE